MNFRNISPRLFVIAILVLFAAAPCWGQIAKQGSQPTNEPINVTADKLSSEDGGSQIEATGNVEVKRQQTTLKGDQVRFNRETQDVDAKGNISVDDPEWKVKSADALQMNMEKETGQIEKGDIFIEQGHVSITGQHFQKFDGQTYHIDDAFFTTCLCDSGAPPWKLSGEKMDLLPDGSGTIEKGYFYIMDVPVFYLPYGFFPLKSDRQTGFLFPTIGHSTKDGFRFQQPFFWAISKSSDATVAFDVESSSRIGLLGEFRTIFERNADFQFRTAYFDERLRKNEQNEVWDPTIANPQIPLDRWSILSSHRYATASDWLTYSDIAVYSDDSFARNLIERFDLPGTKEFDIRRSRFSDSSFGVFKNWDDSYFKGQWNFYQDFIQKESSTLQKTPQISYWGRRFLDDFPLEFRWQAGGVNYIRQKGGDGLRFDLRPEVSLPFRLASYLYGSLNVAPRETVYHLYTPVNSSDRNVSRELVEISGNIATSLSRVYGWRGLGLDGVKHVIEPELSYLFIPGVNQRRIPIMDDIDRINRRNVLTFGITNRLWGKFANPLVAQSGDKDVELLNPAITDISQLGSLRLALSYDFTGESHRQPAPRTCGVSCPGSGDYLSDVDMNLRVTPTNYLSLGFDGGVHPGTGQVSQVGTSFTISDPRPLLRQSLDPDFNRSNYFSLNYDFVRRGPNGLLAENANLNLDAPVVCPNPADQRCSYRKSVVGNISARLFLHVTDNILFAMRSTYNARDNSLIGFNGATKILSTCECWAITIGVKQEISPAKTSVNFDFNLPGLGSQKSTLK
jgi:LPS-assembly protein